MAYTDILSLTLGSHPQSELQDSDSLIQDLMQAIRISPEQNAKLLETIHADFQTEGLRAY